MDATRVLLSMWVTLSLATTPNLRYCIAQEGTIVPVAVSGAVSPNGVGVFSELGAPAINDLGEAAFTATIAGSSSSRGVFRGNGLVVAQVARQGQAAHDEDGVLSWFVGPAVNNSSQVAFTTGVNESSSGDRRIYRGDKVLTEIAASDQVVPDGNGEFHHFFVHINDYGPAFNEANQAAFVAGLTGTLDPDGDDVGVFHGNGDSVTQVAREGHAAPTTDGIPNGVFDGFAEPALNDFGQTAFYATLTDTTGAGGDDEGIYRGSASGTRVIEIVRERLPNIEEPNGIVDISHRPVINNAGEVAFLATTQTLLFGPRSTVYRGDGKPLVVIAQEGQTVPDGEGTFSSLVPPDLNDRGQAAFSALLTGTTESANLGVYLGDGESLVKIARKGEIAPDGATFLGVEGNLEVNNAGVVQMVARLSAAEGGSDRAILLGDGRDLLVVAREHQPLAGSSIASFAFEGGGAPPNRGGRQTLNESGQVAFQATLENGLQGVFVFTPPVQWRVTLDGAWDDVANWTLSLSPSVAHQVTLDPDVDLTVTGPSADTTVSSLTVGGGEGIVTLQMQPGLSFTANHGLVAVRPNGVFSHQGTLRADLLNEGTVRVPGNATVDGSFVNEVNAETIISLEICCQAGLAITGDLTNRGTLQLTGDAAANTSLLIEGTLTNELGGTIDLLAGAGGTRVIDADLVNRGTMTFAAPANLTGTLSVDLGTVNIDAPLTVRTYRQTRGTLAGSGDLTVTDSFLWTGGALAGTGTTSVDGNAEISGVGTRPLRGRSLRNNGTVTWSGGRLDGGMGSILDNRGTLDIASDVTTSFESGADPIWNNSGTIVKSDGTGVTDIHAEFNNHGLVQVDSGTLRFRKGGTSSGTFTIASTATADFSNGAHTLAAESVVTGEGTVRVSVGPVAVQGSYDVDHTVVHQGKLNFLVPVQVANLTLSGGSGRIGGSSTLTITDTFLWTEGSMVDGGKTIIAGTAEISGIGSRTMDARTLEINGSAIWSGGRLDGGVGAILDNHGTFEIVGDRTTATFGGTAPAWNNTGVLVKSSGSGVAEIHARFTNSGTVEVRAGTLRFDEFTQTDGVTDLNDGDLGVPPWSRVDIQGGRLIGTGTVFGRVLNSAIVSPGTSAGQIAIDGEYHQTANGMLIVEIGGLAGGAEFDQLRVADHATLGGVLQVELLPGLDAPAGSEFEVISASTIDVEFDEIVLPTGDLGDTLLDVISGEGRVTLVALQDLYVPLDFSQLDFNTDGSIDVGDIDLLIEEVVAQRDLESFDLSGDGIVNRQDISQWLADAAIHNGFRGSYLRGDSNLDGSVNGLDLNSLGSNWQQVAAGWSTGDFTADGLVNATDLNALALNWQQSVPVASPAKTVIPEPSTGSLVIAVVLCCAYRRRPTHTPSNRQF